VPDRLIILGAGGHGAVVADLAEAAGWTVVGFVDGGKHAGAEGPDGRPVLGDDAWLAGQSPNEVKLANGLGSVRDTVARRKLYEHFADRGFVFPPLIHPTAVVSARAEVGAGVIVMAGSVVQTGGRLSENVIVNTSASVDHHCCLGAHAHIAPGAVLSGGVTVGTGAHLGTGCVIIQQIRIGEGALVGAGAVVLADVPDGGRVAAGNTYRGTLAVG